MEISTTKFRLLEINLISALELKLPRSLPLCEDLHTYAVVWIDPKQKLRSRVDVTGFENPKWNEKFVFVVDTKTLNSLSTADLVIELYCIRRSGKDRLIGTSRVLLGSFGNCGRCYYEGTTGTFRVFYVRGRNGEPRGILNLGVTILDGLLPYQVTSDQFMGIGSAIDYQKLFGDKVRAVGKDKEGCLAA